MQPFPADTILGGYRLLELIAQGGMGQVYRAVQLSIERTVAIKVLSTELVERSPNFAVQFLREARAAAVLSHPHIVTVHDAGTAEVDERVFHYFSMEFIDGENLRVRIERDGPLPLELIGRVMLEVGRALAYAAGMGMVHRDIKPENIMLTKNGLVKLTDFGLVLWSAEEGQVTSRIMGTPRYMSPEAATGDTVDLRSDQYSLGASLFHFLTGKTPYHHTNRREQLEAHIHEPVPDPADHGDVPPAWRQLCRRLLAKNPAHRFRTHEAMVEAIEAVIAEKDLPPIALPRRGAPRRTNAVSPPQASSAQTSAGLPAWLFIAVGVGGLLVFLIALSVVFHKPQPPVQAPPVVQPNPPLPEVSHAAVELAPLPAATVPAVTQPSGPATAPGTEAAGQPSIVERILKLAETEAEAQRFSEALRRLTILEPRQVLANQEKITETRERIEALCLKYFEQAKNEIRSAANDPAAKRIIDKARQTGLPAHLIDDLENLRRHR